MNKNRFLIAFDLDGTLLNDENKIITPKTKEYLIKLTKMGHLIVLASGRPSSEIMPYYKELGLDTPLVCFSGIHCFHPNDESFQELRGTYDKQIAIDLVRDLLGRCVENAFVEDDKKIWMLKKDEPLENLMWPHGIKREIAYGPFEKTLERNPMSFISHCVNIKGDPDYYEEYISKIPGATLRFWFDKKFAEVSFCEHTKGSSLEHIRQYYKIPKDHTIAFGDYTNDIEMVTWAGHGVAMQNGTDELKRVAKYVTKEDNNHDGIVDTLKSIIEAN